MNKTLHKLAALLLVILVTGCAQVPSVEKKGEQKTVPSEELVAYDSSLYSVERPAGWEVEENDNFVYFKTPVESDSNNLQENIVVYVALLKNPEQDLVHFVQDSFKVLMSTVRGFAIVDHGKASFGDFPAYKIIYTEGEEGSQTKYLQVFAIKNGNSHILTYTAPLETFDKYLPEAEAIVSSYRIK